MRAKCWPRFWVSDEQKEHDAPDNIFIDLLNLAPMGTSFTICLIFIDFLDNLGEDSFVVFLRDVKLLVTSLANNISFEFTQIVILARNEAGQSAQLTR